MACPYSSVNTPFIVVLFVTIIGVVASTVTCVNTLSTVKLYSTLAVSYPSCSTVTFTVLFPVLLAMYGYEYLPLPSVVSSLLSPFTVTFTFVFPSGLLFSSTNLPVISVESPHFHRIYWIRYYVYLRHWNCHIKFVWWIFINVSTIIDNCERIISTSY